MLPAQIYAEEGVSDWSKPGPVISNTFDLSPSESVPYSINGNRECIKQRVVTRPRKVLPYWPYLQDEQYHDSCIVNTGYGAVSLSGYLQVPGENTFGTVHYPWGKKMTLLGVPNGVGALYLEPNLPNGVTISQIPDFLSHISATTLANGEIKFTVKEGTTIRRLEGPDGKPLGVALDSISFSFGGKWMVADIPYLGLTRIDTRSLTMKTFDPAYFNYDIGSVPAVQSTVTASGRYVAIASTNYTRFKLYDLEDCLDSRNCRSVDLRQYFLTKMPGFSSAVRLRFTSDYSLKLYAIHQPPGKPKTVTGLSLRAAGHEAAGFGYLGMGDSFASGEGAYQYKAITDTDDNECHLSLRSYAYLIGAELNLNSYESVACSGALLDDVMDFSNKYPDDPQARGKKDEKFDKEVYESFYPGYREQINYIDRLEPESITLSIGGNDIGFDDKLKACVMPGTCYESYEDRLETALEINNLFDRLVSNYTEIKGLMPRNKIYIIGYPSIAAENGNCAQNVRLNNDEIIFSNQLVRHLNKNIKAAADKVGVFYVDVEDAFKGQRLCEASSFAIAINGLTAGDDTDVPFTTIDLGGPIGNESYHPNAIGHELLKKAILNKTSDFTASMPTPNESAKPPQISSSMELLKDAPRKYRNENTVKYMNSMFSSEILKNEELKGTIKMTDSGFKPSSEIEVWMHSEPVKLGSLMTDEYGDLDISLALPSATPYGFHTIHVYGTSMTGKPLDMQKVIYVAADKPPEPLPEKSEPNQSNGDPKPPSNNPETEAGHEQLMREENSDTTIASTTPGGVYGASVYETPVPASINDPNPEVSGVQDENTTPGDSPVYIDRPSYWPLLGGITFGMAVVMLVSTKIKKD